MAQNFGAAGRLGSENEHVLYNATAARIVE